MKQLNLGKIEMQIPKENSYNSLTISRNFDDKFNELSQYYRLYNPDELKDFIKKHEITLDFIHEITPLVYEYFPKHDKTLEFCKDPEFKSLDFIIINIKCIDFEKDYITLEKFEDEPLYNSKYERKINGLVSVDLW